MKKISILGSTGSIGTSSLNVIARYPRRFKVVGLSAGNNRNKLLQQIRQFKPEIVSIMKKEDADFIRERVKGKIRVLYGSEGNNAVAEWDNAGIVISAITGKEAIIPTYSAIKKRKTIALAAKEILVSCGEFIMNEAASYGVDLLPVDSEHSAVFQCLRGENEGEVEKVILTASGGPFINSTMDELKSVTLSAALKHPNWKMGKKITIDSATLMNKGLEIIEAHHLFNLSFSCLDVLIHPQSIIHSLVMFKDGSVKAQMSIPDMKIPILYALTFPERLTFDVPRLNLIELKELTFDKPDEKRFPCLRLAKQALKEGNSMPVALNAANDCAVNAFLQERISFNEIPEIIEKVMMHHDNKRVTEIDQALEIDQKARDDADKIMRKRK